MKKSRLAALVTLVAVLSIAGGFAGHKIEDILDQEYHQGIAFLHGSGAFKTAIGMAVLETTPKGVILKVQLSGAPEAANRTLDIKIATTSGADVVKVGIIKMDDTGKGTATVKAKDVQDFPRVVDGSVITLKMIGNNTVAEGVFGAP